MIPNAKTRPTPGTIIIGQSPIIPFRGTILPGTQRRVFDKDVDKALNGSLNDLVDWYVIASYAKCVLETPLISEHTYSRICTKLYSSWDKIRHEHKYIFFNQDNFMNNDWTGRFPPNLHQDYAFLMSNGTLRHRVFV